MQNNEKVLVINRSNLPKHWLGEKVSLPVTLSDINKLTGFAEWPFRQEAESNETLKQLIPYIVLRCSLDNTLAVYRRKGTEKRLHGLYSIGIGGHINPIDWANNNTKLSQTIIKAARREFAEELHLLNNDFQCVFKGIINEELSKVGRVHIGLVFEITLNYKPEPKEELKGLHWISQNRVGNYKMELWSEMALKLL